MALLRVAFRVNLNPIMELESRTQTIESRTKIGGGGRYLNCNGHKRRTRKLTQVRGSINLELRRRGIAARGRAGLSCRLAARNFIGPIGPKGPIGPMNSNRESGFPLTFGSSRIVIPLARYQKYGSQPGS
jgi:hypothetical protein